MKDLSINDVIDIAIRAEDLGAKAYVDLSKKFSNDSNLKDLFENLARDEVEHKLFFTELSKKTSNLKLSLAEVDREFLQGVDISKFFEPIQKSQDMSITDIFKLIYDFEKESVLFYVGIRDVVEDEKILDEIIRVEKDHMNRIMKFILTDSLYRGIKDNWK